MPSPAAVDPKATTALPERKKRISIFVIVYNAVNKLDWTIDRIPEEVWEKVDEVFLFDDCSTDNTYYAAIGRLAVV